MAMGTTGTLNVSPEMIANAKEAIETYRGNVSTLRAQLQDTVNGLIPSGFEGSAATSYKAFFEKSVLTLLDTTGGEGVYALLKALDDICDGILNAIPAAEGVDEKLAEGNGQSGSSESAT